MRGMIVVIYYYILQSYNFICIKKAASRV